MSFPSRKRKRSNLRVMDLDRPESHKRVCIDLDSAIRIAAPNEPVKEFIDVDMFSDMESFLYNGPDSHVRFVNSVYKKTAWFDYAPIVNKLSGSVGFGQKNVTISLPL